MLQIAKDFVKIEMLLTDHLAQLRLPFDTTELKDKILLMLKVLMRFFLVGGGEGGEKLAYKLNTC